MALLKDVRSLYNVKTPGEIALLEERREKSGKRNKRYEHPIEIHPDGRRIFGKDENGKPICFSLKSALTGERCKRTPLHSGRCWRHKGISAKVMKVKADNQKHGAYGRLPKHLLQGMDRAAKKPDGLSLLDDIHFCDARIDEISKSLAEQGTPSENVMVSLAMHVANLLSSAQQTEEINGEDVLRGRNLRSLFQKLSALEEFIAKVANYRASITDLLGVQRQKSSLIETELRKRMADSNQMPTEQVALLCVQLVDIFMSIMKDAREVNEAAVRVRQWQTKALSSGPMSHLLENEPIEYGASGAKSPEEIRAMSKSSEIIDAEFEIEKPKIKIKRLKPTSPHTSRVK